MALTRHGKKSPHDARTTLGRIANSFGPAGYGGVGNSLL